MKNQRDTDSSSLRRLNDAESSQYDINGVLMNKNMLFIYWHNGRNSCSFWTYLRRLNVWE